MWTEGHYLVFAVTARVGSSQVEQKLLHCASRDFCSWHEAPRGGGCDTFDVPEKRIQLASVFFALIDSHLLEETHLRVLRLLQENPCMKQRELAKTLGVSLGKTNYCLKALLNKGLIKTNNFRSSSNKLAYAYLLTPLGIAEKARLTSHFLKLKVAEYDALWREIEMLQQEVAQHSNALQATREE